MIIGNILLIVLWFIVAVIASYLEEQMRMRGFMAIWIFASIRVGMLFVSEDNRARHNGRFV